MNPYNEPCKEVTVTAMTFKNKGQLSTIPKRIEFDNQIVTFVDSGMQYLVKKGQDFIRLFDMSDGHTNYRLCHDATKTWTLIRTQPLTKI